MRSVMFVTAFDAAISKLIFGTLSRMSPTGRFGFAGFRFRKDVAVERNKRLLFRPNKKGVSHLAIYGGVTWQADF